MVRLTAGGCTILVDTGAGGRMAQIFVDDQPLLVDPGESDPHPPSIAWGSFVMAPWVGRIGHGVFEFEGVQHQLGLNHRDGEEENRLHSIHGTVFARPWTIVESTADSLSMWCPLSGALDWPYEGVAKQRIDLRDDRVRLELSLESGDAPFPAEIGWHPWLRKPDHLSFEPSAMFERDDLGLPTGAIVAPTEGPWDDCFLNTEPVILHYDRPTAPEVRIESDCDHWVIFDEPINSTCVEPQSGPPDAFRLGAHVVTPGNPLRRSMSISW